MAEGEISEEVMTYAKLLASRSKLWSSELERLCRRWRMQIVSRQRVHKKLADAYNRRYYGFGIPTTILSALVSSGVFASIQDCSCDPSIYCQASIWIRLACGIISLVTMILSACTLFLNYQARSEQHKASSDSYEILAREIDSILILPIVFRGDPTSVVNSFLNKYNDLVKNSPNIPEKWTDSKLVMPPPPPMISDSTDDGLRAMAQLLDSTDTDSKKEQELVDVCSHTTDDEGEIKLEFDLESLQPSVP